MLRVRMKAKPSIWGFALCRSGFHHSLVKVRWADAENTETWEYSFNLVFCVPAGRREG